jgi:hypothetical protein
MRYRYNCVLLLPFVCLLCAAAHAQESQSSNTAPTQRELQLQREVDELERRLSAMEAKMNGQPATAASSSSPAPASATPNMMSASSNSASGVAPVSTASVVTPEKAERSAPFAYADWTWLNGTPHNKDAVWDSKFFTPEIRFDTNFVHSFNNPRDDSLGGSTEIFRHDEFQVEQISFGGDFHWQNVRGRVLTLGGMFGVTTPRNDASVDRGQ